MFLAHVRATTGTREQTNRHPFRHRRWRFVHNGVIKGFEAMRRDLLDAVDAALFDGVTGSTDSEALFDLALTSGSTTIRSPPRSERSGSSRPPGGSMVSRTPSR